MNLGFFGIALSGRSVTLRALASQRGAKLGRDRFTIASLELRSSGGSNDIGVDERLRSELLAWADALVIVLHTEQLMTRFRTEILGKPRIYPINKIDIRSADWLRDRLPHLGWEPRMDVIETAMLDHRDPATKPTGVDALWKAIERLTLRDG